MAIYTNLPIYKATYSLLLSVSKMLPNLPRDCRYSIGTDLRAKVMEIIILIYRANRTKNKAPIITRMRETLLEAQVYVRLLCDMRHISEGKYTELAERTQDMSRQMAAWEKSVTNKQNSGRGEEAPTT
ncbi:MAG: four helix bundle protein [Prevotellaceae bacterium]|nr:four helix bundle protein [Prevotellaceae bacterium]